MANAAATLASDTQAMLITSMMATSTIQSTLLQRSLRNMFWKSVQRTLIAVRPIIIAVATRPVINMAPGADTKRYRTAIMWIISSTAICTIPMTVTATITAPSK
jgi:hypothetical protein